MVVLPLASGLISITLSTHQASRVHGTMEVPEGGERELLKGIIEAALIGVSDGLLSPIEQEFATELLRQLKL